MAVKVEKAKILVIISVKSLSELVKSTIKACKNIKAYVQGSVSEMRGISGLSVS